MPLKGPAFLALVMLAAPAFAVAQSTQPAPATRAEAQRDAEAAKAKSLTPQVATRLEKFIGNTASEFEDPHGPAVAFGNIYTGGWFALGPSYRQYLGERTTFFTRAMYSVRQYVMAEANVTANNVAINHLDLIGYVRWMDAKQVPYFGLGPDTSRDDRTNYRFQQTTVGGAATFRPVYPIRITAGLGYEGYENKRGKGSKPSVEDRFDELTAPGLRADPRFVRARVRAALDWREAQGYSRTGGLYAVELNRFQDTHGPWDFSRLDADAVQHLPLLRENLVFSLRGSLQTTIAGETHEPYFMMPAVGGSTTVRGFSSLRFRGPHAMVYSAEYRWIPSRAAVDMAIFFDAGMTALTRSDLKFGDLETSEGIGFRIHSPLATPLRIELAHGREGFRFIFASSAAF